MSSESAPTLSRHSADGTAPAVMARGFYEEQDEAHGRWAARDSAIEFEPADDERYLAFWVLSEFRDLSQELSITIAGRLTRVTARRRRCCSCGSSTRCTDRSTPSSASLDCRNPTGLTRRGEPAQAS